MTDQLNLTGISGDGSDRLEVRKAALLDALKNVGASIVCVSYDGEGDSGQIESISATGAMREDVDLRVPFPADKDARHGPESLYEAIEDYCWELLGAYHCGFQDNDGGFGEFTIDVAAGTIHLRKHDRYASYHTSELEV